jgi:DNA-binding NarL/FixJ family response regulator
MDGNPMMERINVVVVNPDLDGPSRLASLLSGRREVAVVAAMHGFREAVGVAERLGADVVLVDAGRSTLEDLCSTRPIRFPQRLIVVAAGEDHDLLIASVQAGATGYVVADDTRDLPAAELVAVIEAVHAGESVVPGRMLRPLLIDLFEWARHRDRAMKESDRLSPRQREILLLMGSGTNLGDMAQALNVSVYTVRSHIHELLRKLRVHSRSEAVEWGVASGVLDHLRREADPQAECVAAGM